MSRSELRRSRVRRLVLASWSIVVFTFAACGSPTMASPNGSAAATGSETSSIAGSAAPSAAGAPSVASQTDTDWGRIWDSLPSDFPVVAGSTPSEEAATGPASAALVVDGNAAEAVVTSMKASLERAGFRTDGLTGPLENGGYVLDAVGPPAGCMVQVAAHPLGTITTVTVLYGAVCPHG